MRKCLVLSILLLCIGLPAFARAAESHSTQGLVDQLNRLIERREQSWQHQEQISRIKEQSDNRRNQKDSTFKAIQNNMINSQMQIMNANIQRFNNNLDHYQKLDAQGRRKFVESLTDADRKNFELGCYRLLSKPDQKRFYPSMTQGAKDHVAAVENFGKRSFGAQWVNYEFAQLEAKWQKEQYQEILKQNPTFRPEDLDRMFNPPLRLPMGQQPKTSDTHSSDAFMQEIMKQHQEDRAKLNEQMQQQSNQINQMFR